MKRFLVFAYDGYYPSGGLHDLHGEYYFEEDAKSAAAALERDYDYVEIVDSVAPLDKEKFPYAISK